MGKRLKSDGSLSSKKITFSDPHLLGVLCGGQNTHLKLIEKKVGVAIHVRGNDLTLHGGDWEIDLAEKALKQLYDLIKNDYPIFLNDVDYAVRILSRNQTANVKEIFLDRVYISSSKKVITPNQQHELHR